MHGSADEGRRESLIPHVAPDPRGTILTASPKWPWAGSLADRGNLLSRRTTTSGETFAMIGRRLAAGYFPIQNRLKITPSRSSELNSPVIEFSWSCASRSSSANRSSA